MTATTPDETLICFDMSKGGKLREVHHCRNSLIPCDTKTCKLSSSTRSDSMQTSRNTGQVLLCDSLLYVALHTPLEVITDVVNSVLPCGSCSPVTRHWIEHATASLNRESIDMRGYMSSACFRRQAQLERGHHGNESTQIITATW